MLPQDFHRTDLNQFFGIQAYNFQQASPPKSMNSLVLYCKSFHIDLKRVVRLAKSVGRHNRDGLDFYLSVPKKDIQLFEENLHGLNVKLFADEDVIAANPQINQAVFSQLPGHISQQIVKSEFWRISPADAYLCLDSDSVFIRDFGLSDYMTSNGVPYTVLTEAHDLQYSALVQRKIQILDNFQREAASVQKRFGREGRTYSFGPMPMVWHRAVWESLEQAYLQPNGMSFMDAILLAPLESRWYGEALFKFHAVPLLPCEPFFKVYHYAWQLDQDRRHGLKEDQLARLYSGIIYQSSWERDMDWPKEGGSSLSKLTRRLKRKMGRI